MIEPAGEIVVSKRAPQTSKAQSCRGGAGRGIVWFIRADCQNSRTRPQIWRPVGANQSQCPAPLGQRTVFSRFGCVLLRRAKNLIAFSKAENVSGPRRRGDRLAISQCQKIEPPMSARDPPAAAGGLDRESPGVAGRDILGS